MLNTLNNLLTTQQPQRPINLKALENFSRLGFPTRKNEHWKYTSFSGIYEENFTLDQNKLSLPINDEWELFQQDICNESNDGLYQFNLALANRPEIFEIDQNKTIYLHHSILANENVFYHRHYFFHVKAGQTLNLQQTWNGQGSEKIFFNTTLTIVADEGASVHLLQANKSGANTTLAQYTRIFAKKDSHVKAVLLQTSGQLNRHHLYVDLKESGANVETYGLYHTEKEEHSDCQLYVKHSAAHTTSTQLYKGMLDGSSRAIFTGKIRIEKQAQQVAAKQLNRNILLSKKAQMHSLPQLEVYADDVKAAHGSATGQLDDDQLFYFQSRGIDPIKAKLLLGQAFGQEILFQIENKAWQKEMLQLASDKFLNSIQSGVQSE